MENVALIGIDLGKHSFHIHCQDKSGKALLRKKFTRTKLMQFLATCPSSVCSYGSLCRCAFYGTPYQRYRS